ncbi:MAG: GNAT family N-acetyltransferase [Fimbriimonadaceae bacterium]
MARASAELLRRIDAHIVAVTAPTRTVRDAGPFRIMVDPATELIYLNYAVPLRGGFDAGSIALMVDAFNELGRRPRLEFRREAWPGLEAELVRNGFELEAEQPMMICTPEAFVPASGSEVEVEILGPSGDIEAFCSVADSAFGMNEPVSRERIERVRKNIESRLWICALGRVGGDAAGCATVTPHDGVCELAGVGTAARFRRRGVASAVSSSLLEEHFQTGDLAWLSAGDDVARAVYERLGFRVAATHVNYIVES